MHPRVVTTQAPLGPQIGDRAWRCALANGHELTAITSRKWAAQLPPLSEGMIVSMEISTVDFSVGRVVGVVSE